MKVYVADMERETIIEPPVSVRAYLVQTVDEFKTLVAQVSIKYTLVGPEPSTFNFTKIGTSGVLGHLCRSMDR